MGSETCLDGAVASSRGSTRRDLSVEHAVVAAPSFADEGIDLGVSHLELHDLIDWHDALMEAARTLRPGAGVALKPPAT